jgi:ABC-type antimicrobial peptide transport system permease subunit
MALVLKHGAMVVASGLAIGFVGAVALRDVMATLVYGIQTSDPMAYLAAALVLLAGTLSASAIPARRASRLDPVVALRSE